MLVDQTQALALAWSKEVDRCHYALEAYGGLGATVNDALNVSSTLTSRLPASRMPRGLF